MPSPLRRIGVYLELVYTFPAIILVGAALGYLLDWWLGTSPILILIGFVVGIVGSFYYLIKMLNSIKNESPRDDG